MSEPEAHSFPAAEAPRRRRDVTSETKRAAPEVGAVVQFCAAPPRAGRPEVPAIEAKGKPGDKDHIAAQPKKDEVPPREALVWPATVTAVHPVETEGAMPTLDLAVERTTNTIDVDNVPFSADPAVPNTWTFPTA